MKRTKNRKGFMLADVLVAIIVIAVSLLPLLGSMCFGFFSVMTSDAITRDLHDFYDRVDDSIVLGHIDDWGDIEVGKDVLIPGYNGSVNLSVYSRSFDLKYSNTRSFKVRNYVLK